VSTLRVEPLGAEHLSVVQGAYADARVLQREQGAPIWPDFPDSAIVAELAAGHLFRVMDGDDPVGVFTVAYEDPAIWGERERGAHVYLHRLARVRTASAHGLLGAVLDWARARAREMGREGLRIDTWATNAPLIAYYVRNGFRVVETRMIGADPRLLSHYHGIELALLEEDARSAQASGRTVP
jgi:GNAT superfamily N-acetyltransferase